MNLEKTFLYCVSVDYENKAEEWWDRGGRELWEAFSGGKFFAGKKASGAEIAAFLEAAEKIPGWNTGPDHAKYPFYMIGFEDLSC